MLEEKVSKNLYKLAKEIQIFSKKSGMEWNTIYIYRKEN